MKRSFARPASVTVVQKGRRKSAEAAFQTYDQSSILNELDESSGNFIARVIRGGEEPMVRLTSYLFGSKQAELAVRFRKAELPQSNREAPKSSFFKRTLQDTPAAHTNQKHDEVPSLNEGDIVELRSCLLDENYQTLYPWEHRVISSASLAGHVLMMPETLSCLVTRSDVDDPAKKEYSVVMPGRSEKITITGMFEGVPRLKDFISQRENFIEGFIIRGKKHSKSKVCSGYSFVRNRKHDDNNATADQIIIDFLKAKGEHLTNYVSEANPWEVIPLYRIPVAQRVVDRVEALAKRATYCVFQDSDAYELSFVHANVVLDYSLADNGPRVVSYSLSRAKPLLLDTGLPERAKETKIKMKVERQPDFAFA